MTRRRFLPEIPLFMPVPCTARSDRLCGSFHNQSGLMLIAICSGGGAIIVQGTLLLWIIFREGVQYLDSAETIRMGTDRVFSTPTFPVCRSRPSVSIYFPPLMTSSSCSLNDASSKASASNGNGSTCPSSSYFSYKPPISDGIRRTERESREISILLKLESTNGAPVSAVQI